MKFVNAILLSLTFVLIAANSSHAKIDLDRCNALTGDETSKAEYRAVMSITSPQFWTSNVISCALTDSQALVEENLIRQEAASVHFSPDKVYTPYLSAYGAIREHQLDFHGPASPELADEVLRSKPGSIAELLKREALRRQSETEAAQK